MDIIKNNTSKKSTFYNKWLIMLFIAGCSYFWLSVNKSFGQVTIARESLLIEKVQRGDLDVVVDGYGKLISNKQLLISTLTNARVKEIILKPGALVEKGSVIVRLENPELQQQVDDEQQQLAQKQGNLRQLKLTQKRELLLDEADLAKINADLQSATLKRKAEQQLLTKGIVSKLVFEQTRLHEVQLRQRLGFLKLRTEQLREVHLEAINIMEQRIKQQRVRLVIAQSRLASLDVQADFSGVLQKLSVELGQNLLAGQTIGLIGSVSDLVAIIKVPQSQAQQIRLRQQVVIDTRSDKIIGQVSRIDPIVSNNTVSIEIALPNKLPSSARPELNVDGQITITTLKNILYLKRPANIKSNAQSLLYKVDKTNQQAKQQSIQFGQQAGRYIQILSGAKLNEQYIISDLANIKATVSTLNID
ncbi:RND transporter [Colwellia sp. 75C3]|uniref:efflux RND transporter periplasmic adaptor subunit n=1 Tax=Colwellia sp. 75C3 TaxID=888425 RepID=UPI000C32199A|nr:HlyD family efflux transporter periplasmic adaptor subunit [Colwellia sp. 75C3]PKG84686.1 RND transporter [Colwellia sp. 75C3]